MISEKMSFFHIIMLKGRTTIHDALHKTQKYL